MALRFVESSGSRSPAAVDTAGPLHPVVLIALGSLVSFALSWPHLMDVWRTGTFYDTDDAMRMVQVRTWMAGQPWFDLSVHRLARADGMVMHWSRIVDIPLGALIRLFDLFTDPVTAERLTRIVFPLAMQVGLIAATLYAARVLAGRVASVPATVLAVTSCVQFGQFVAGRVDHHAPQITLLMLMAGLASDAIAHRRVRSAALAAICLALSMAISLENLPFIAIVIAAVALTWGFGGVAYAAVLRGFGLSLALCAPLLFVITVPPWRYGLSATDAFSAPHVIAAALAGLAFVGLPSVFRGGGTRMSRLLAIGIAGAGVAALIVGFFPVMVQSPFAQIDPVVRAVWLSHVTEAQPLPAALRLHPQAATLILGPLVAGLLAICIAACRERGPLRGAWILIGLLTLAGLAGSLWEIRIIASATPLALLGGVWAFAAVQSALAVAVSKSMRTATLASSALLLVFSPMAWILVPVPEEDLAVSEATKAAALCRDADTLGPLASLGSGVVFAPIDSGSHLLAHTGVSVFGAPYHRNNAANRLVIDGFAASPADAEPIVKGSGAQFVALCPGQVQAGVLRTRNPTGLAAALLDNHPPSWLQPVPIEGTRYRVFAVK